MRPWVFPHSCEHRPLPGSSPVLWTSAPSYDPPIAIAERSQWLPLSMMP
eukprot:COSAG02_NODE_68660_length_231_cov_4.090909_1_plen_48_part_10